MKSNLFTYTLFGVINCYLMWIFTKYLVSAVLNENLLLTFIWSTILALDIDGFIERQRNFTKYYPNFEDKWTYLI